jgi:hypothetical protein
LRSIDHDGRQRTSPVVTIGSLRRELSGRVAHCTLIVTE